MFQSFRPAKKSEGTQNLAKLGMTDCVSALLVWGLPCKLVFTSCLLSCSLRSGYPKPRVHSLGSTRLECRLRSHLGACQCFVSRGLREFEDFVPCVISFGVDLVLFKATQKIRNFHGFWPVFAQSLSKLATKFGSARCFRQQERVLRGKLVSAKSEKTLAVHVVQHANLSACLVGPLSLDISILGQNPAAQYLAKAWKGLVAGP